MISEKDGEGHCIDITLDNDRYESILKICKNYEVQQGREITLKEYILMLIDSAIGKESS
jgi:hypothetical protein